MFCVLVLWNIFHPGQILVGPNSEFLKKQKKGEKVAEEKEVLLSVFPNGKSKLGNSFCIGMDFRVLRAGASFLGACSSVLPARPISLAFGFSNLVDWVFWFQGHSKRGMAQDWPLEVSCGGAKRVGKEET
ncbi:hypothetical protein DFH08DRAFT_810304 [Mycena albidolilacea]|uniref:Uncharacterized protein n=1 Tax=Mycena albidolilacea TaxID=1033008 RepID=A0AAD6ZY09_9AGAR|nr:hypothetical protein DFH08DRAFT_810304 [Mycena albidolilacea]